MHSPPTVRQPPAEKTRSKWIAGLISLLLILSGTAYGLSLITDTKAGEHRSQEIPTVQTLTKLKLIDQHGKRLLTSDIRDKPVLLNFYFTACGSACPLQTAVLRDVQKGLDESVDVLFVSATISPQSDTPESVHHYIEKHDIEHSNWRFVRTDVDRTEKLISEFKVTVDDRVVNPDQPNHRNMAYLFGRNGNLMQQYQLVPGINKRLIREITEVSQLSNSGVE